MTPWGEPHGPDRERLRREKALRVEHKASVVLWRAACDFLANGTTGNIERLDEAVRAYEIARTATGWAYDEEAR